MPAYIHVNYKFEREVGAIKLLANDYVHTTNLQMHTLLHVQLMHACMHVVLAQDNKEIL